MNCIKNRSRWQTWDKDGNEPAIEPFFDTLRLPP